MIKNRNKNTMKSRFCALVLAIAFGTNSVALAEIGLNNELQNIQSTKLSSVVQKINIRYQKFSLSKKLRVLKRAKKRLAFLHAAIDQREQTVRTIPMNAEEIEISGSDVFDITNQIQTSSNLEKIDRSLILIKTSKMIDMLDHEIVRLTSTSLHKSKKLLNRSIASNDGFCDFGYIASILAISIGVCALVGVGLVTAFVSYPVGLAMTAIGIFVLFNTFGSCFDDS